MIYEVIIDSGEKPNKCTIAPLSSRPDFRLYRVRGISIFGPLSSSVILHHEGQCLTTVRKSKGEVHGIASVDCVWPRLDVLLRRIVEPLPLFARIPDGFETAYPRISKENTDPKNGLATIEAIFIASALLGKWDTTLLARYYFGRKFVQLNKKRFLDLGVHEASNEDLLPVLSHRPRNSLQRRLDRGRF